MGRKQFGNQEDTIEQAVHYFLSGRPDVVPGYDRRLLRFSSIC